MTTRKTKWCCGLAAWLALGAMAAAQDSPWELFNKDVDVLLRLQEPDRAVEGIIALVDAVQPGTGALIEGQAADVLGKLISNPGLIGVDQSRDWYAGVYGEGLNEPNVVFAIPAVDPKELQQALGEEITTRAVGNWVLYSESEEIPDVEQEHAGTALSEPAMKLFRQGTVGVFINVARLNSAYSEEIETAQEQTFEGLNQLRFMIPQQQQGVDLGPIIEMYGSLAEGIFQGLADTSALTVSVSVDENGLAIDELVEFTDGSSTRERLGRHPTSAMENMDRLPADGVMYYGVSGAMRDLIRWGTEFSLGMVQGEEAKQKLTESLKPLDDITFGPIVSAVEMGRAETGLLLVSGISVVQPIDAFKKFARDSSQAMGNLEFQGFKQEIALEVDAEEFGDLKGDVLTTRQEYDEALDPTGMQRKMQSIMFGPDGMVTRSVYLDDRFLSTMGGGSEQMKKLIDRQTSDKGANLPQYALPLQEKRNLLVYLDLPTSIAKGLGFVAESGTLPLPIDENMIANLNLTPSYLAFALGTEEGRIRCETRIPAEQFTGMAKLGLLLFALSQQAGQL